MKKRRKSIRPDFLYSENNSPEIKKPESTKKRSTPIPQRAIPDREVGMMSDHQEDHNPAQNIKRSVPLHLYAADSIRMNKAPRMLPARMAIPTTSHRMR